MKYLLFLSIGFLLGILFMSYTLEFDSWPPHIRDFSRVRLHTLETEIAELHNKNT